MPYDRDLFQQVTELPAARYGMGGWVVPLDAAVEVAQFVAKSDAQVEPSAVEVIASVQADLRKIADSAARDAELHVDGLGGELMPFQRAGVAYALATLAQRPGVLIADEMGLGKTCQALAVLQARQQFPAVVVCPTSLRINWLREIQRWLPGKKVQVLYGVRPYLTSADVCVIGYDVVHGWHGFLHANALVVDEAHYLKNGSARRTQAVLRLADRIRDRGGFVVMLSGTPVLNNPVELLAQLRIAGVLEDFGGVRRFRQDCADLSTLPMLNRRLRQTCFVRRRKVDVLTDLPPKRHARIVVEGEKQRIEEYRRAERDIVRYLADRAREIADASGETDETARRVAWEAGLRAEASAHLVAITTLKRLAAQAKMFHVEQWLHNFLTTGKKVVVFGWHRDIVDHVSRNFAGGCKVQGGMTDAEKQHWVDRFQTDEHQRVISCSIRAAGVGLTLTSASDVLFVEQGWNPADMEQAADRCHRIGQRDSVTAWHILCEGTVDEYIADLIDEKRALVDAATDGNHFDSSATTSVLGDLLVRLAGQTQL